MFIDTHTHLSDDLGVSPREYIENAKKVNVNYLIVSCCDKKSIIEGLALLEQYDNIFLTIGYHPDEVSNVNDSDISYLEEVIKNNKRIVGIGEIGLDYHFVKDSKEKQRELFEHQLDLASELNMPVVIHSRDAINETYEILSRYNLKGDIHCFSGSLEMAKKFIDIGYYLGIGGVITFKNSNLYKVVESIGISNVILETDSPYLSPIRGSVNESANIPLIAEHIAKILNISVAEVANITSLNAISLFDLDIKL